MKFKIGQNVKVKNSYPPLWGPVIRIDEEYKIYYLHLNFLDYLDMVEQMKNMDFWDKEKLYRYFPRSIWLYKEEDLEDGY